MESDDLIEISAEDDSLLSLQLVPSAEACSSNNTSIASFSHSPLLQIPRSSRSCARPHLPPISSSSLDCGKDCGDADQISPSSSQGGNGKESVKMNPSETPKLGVDHQKMKRKKGGGYNLRKSLAWDRAFFTEEGVLDPMELSILSGNIDSCSGGRLSTIHEEAKSVSQKLVRVTESANSQALEDSSIRKSPASIPKRRNMDGLSALKARPSTRSQASASSSAVKLKAMSGPDANRTISKHGGYPRSVASSSLKRPFQPTPSKVANKDQKVSKLSVPKPKPPLSPASSKSVSSNSRNSKHNQISQPAVHAHKPLGQKDSLGSTKIPGIDRKSAYPGKPTARSTVPAGRHVVKSVPEMRSTSNRELPKASKADCGLRVQKNPAVSNPASAIDGSVSKGPVSVSQNGDCNIKSTQTVQIQPAKPSGLRMPSPSLRFFDQSKPSSSQGLPQKTSERGDVPLYGTPSHQKPPRPPRDRAGKMGAECARLSHINGASPAHTKSDLEMKDAVYEEAQVLYKYKGCNPVKGQQSTYNIKFDDAANLLPQDCIESQGIVKISHSDDIELQRENNSLFLQCAQDEILTEHDRFKPIDRSLENSDFIDFAAETKGLLAKTCMISSQIIEGGDASVSGRAHMACLPGDQYVEDAVEYDPIKVPNDLMNSDLANYNTSRKNGQSEFRNDVEGEEYSEFRRANCTEGAVNNGFENVTIDQLCSIPINDRADLESKRPNAISTEEGKSSTKISQHQNLKVLDGTLKVEASPAGESDVHVFSYNQGESTKRVPNEIDDIMKESQVGIVDVHALEASSFVRCDPIMSMPEVDIPWIHNCEADTQTEQPKVTPVGFHRKDIDLSMDRKGESGQVQVVTARDTDVYSCSDDLSQRLVDASVIQNLASRDVRPEASSGQYDTMEASRPSFLQRTKPSDITIDPENQTQECTNWSMTSVCASGGSESENRNYGESQSEVIKLENQFDRNQNMVEETLAADAEVQDSVGSSFADTSNDIVTFKPQEGCEENTMCGQSQVPILKPETEFARNQDMVEEALLEKARVQDSDCTSVDISTAYNCRTHDESVENNVAYQSQSEAVTPNEEFVGEQHVVEKTTMKDEEVQGSDGSFAGLSNVINWDSHERPKSDSCIEEVPSDNCVSSLSCSLLHSRASSADSQDKDVTVDIISGCSLERYDGSFREQDGQLMLQKLTPDIRGTANDKCMHDYQVSNQTMLSSESSLRCGAQETPVRATTSESDSDNEKSGPGVNPSDSFGKSMVLDMDIESPQDNILLGLERRTDIDCETQQELCLSEETAIQQCIKPVNDKKEANAPVIKPPPDAAPFSDEWLAAIEAAGEEILTKKSGAVQHSPPDKSQPEPGPWSPVKKRKNQGPFECTKYTNNIDPST